MVGFAVDFTDAFYQFFFERLAEYFSLDLEIAAGDAGVSEVWRSDSKTYIAVDPSDLVIPCLATLAMGWS